MPASNMVSSGVSALPFLLKKNLLVAGIVGLGISIASTVDAVRNAKSKVKEA